MAGTIIQGSFPRGLAHLIAASPSVQRSPNATVLALPPHLARFHDAGGAPLPAPVRQKMERIFGTSLADVRVHSGPHVSAMGATAFAMGSHLHFAPNQYSPQTPHGQQILGHELAHVVQQRTGRTRNPFATGTTAVVHDVLLEAEAERMRLRVAQTPNRPVQRMHRPPHVRVMFQRNARTAVQPMRAVPHAPPIQRLSETAWKKLTAGAVMEGNHYGLRFQGGPMPTETIKGDCYGLTDPRYLAPLFGMEGSDNTTYNLMLFKSVELAVGEAMGWLYGDNNLTLLAVLNRIDGAGQLVLLGNQRQGLRTDYDAFASVGKHDIATQDVITIIPLLTEDEYKHFQSRFDDAWSGNKSDADDVRDYLVSCIFDRVDAALEQLLS